MSQAKVDRYKKEKANRKQIMRREKMERLAWKVGGSLLGLCFVGWLGFSVYAKTYVPETKSYAVTIDAISDYMSCLSDTDTE